MVRAPGYRLLAGLGLLGDVEHFDARCDRVEDELDDRVGVLHQAALVGGGLPPHNESAAGVEPVTLVNRSVDREARHVAVPGRILAEAVSGIALHEGRGIAEVHRNPVPSAAPSDDFAAGIGDGLGGGFSSEQSAAQAIERIRDDCAALTVALDFPRALDPPAGAHEVVVEDEPRSRHGSPELVGIFDRQAIAAHEGDIAG